MPEKTIDLKMTLNQKDFLEQINSLCAGCQTCGRIDFVDHMTETSTDSTGKTHYICNDCFTE